MKAQSLSVVVPNQRCINDCAFCVSKMSVNTYKNQMDDNLPFFDLYVKDYLKRLEFAQRNGCNTIMLTGDSEPQQNRKFLTYFGLFMQMMRNPFDWIEMQTTGALLNQNYLRFLRNHVGVNVISLSVSSFDNERNMEIIGGPDGVEINLPELCKEIKRYDFTLRLSLNLSKFFGAYGPQMIFRKCKELGADQVTLRVLYADSSETEQGRWVKENAMPTQWVQQIAEYVIENGNPIGRLPYGALKMSLHGLSVVLDDDCMGKRDCTGDGNTEENYKYLILRPDCKLYSAWDDPASLIF